MGNSVGSGISAASESYFSAIAAIDFGTSTSGYAFAIRHDEKTNNLKISDIQLNQWKIDDSSSNIEKAPTTVLLKPDQTFDSFGFKAEDKYTILCAKRDQKDWWYFENFKMELYNTKVSVLHVLTTMFMIYNRSVPYSHVLHMFSASFLVTNSSKYCHLYRQLGLRSDPFEWRT